MTAKKTADPAIDPKETFKQKVEAAILKGKEALEAEKAALRAKQEEAAVAISDKLLVQIEELSVKGMNAVDVMEIPTAEHSLRKTDRNTEEDVVTGVSQIVTEYCRAANLTTDIFSSHRKNWIRVSWTIPQDNPNS